ncbi:DUF4468 domain-containing protein [Pararcticibacter amylolyticus]|uniref:DUF4468 domain-containing protein n=1 Tax=Pararcticibacter amylolyticus TaxID=2173175 RepID=A0A2U2PN01_9SPHI|nr:DUF4468 domain-containing protein [Pararcticibacter amylolyticus]PWG82674.1 hypothetical protein DDR33_02105 [Pararcticibacter amylolyticus]
MKKNLIIIVMFLPLVALSQRSDSSKNSVPLKDGDIQYERIYDLDSTIKKDELYSRAIRWMAKIFIDSKEVIRIADKENGNIVGKGSFDIVTSSFWGIKYRIQMITDITVKDKKYKILFNQFVYRYLNEKTPADQYYPLKRYLKPHRDDDHLSLGHDNKLFREINIKIEELMSSLYKDMSSNISVSDF